MVRTTNGFEIAETDLKIRGPGEFFGTRQHGELGFHLANPLRDFDLLELARREALSPGRIPVGRTRAPSPARAAPAGMAEAISPGVCRVNAWNHR